MRIPTNSPLPRGAGISGDPGQIRGAAPPRAIVTPRAGDMGTLIQRQPAGLTFKDQIPRYQTPQARRNAYPRSTPSSSGNETNAAKITIA